MSIAPAVLARGALLVLPKRKGRSLLVREVRTVGRNVVATAAHRARRRAGRKGCLRLRKDSRPGNTLRDGLPRLDRFRREADSSGMMAGHDAFTEQALGVLTSSRLANALDISQESETTRARYGTGNPKKMIDGNGAPRVPQSFLAARRLVEAGARVVTVNYSKWDWHGSSYGTIFNRQREDHPVLDTALSALMEDLEQRGLLQDTLVGVWGEFGRTPKINKGVGRDHWPNVSFALLGGGSLEQGQVIGATDRHAGEPVARPVKFSELFATLYHHLGLDTETATVNDFQGRPHYLVADGSEPIRELV